MNEVEIVEKINKLQKEINCLKQHLNDSGNKRWTPLYGQKYYAIDVCGRVEYNINNYDCHDEYVIDFYNCFQTQKEAEAESEKILVRRMLENIARRLNKGKKINWNDENQQKYFICYNKNGFDLGYNLEESWGSAYCLDKNFKDIAIEIIGEERLKKFLRGE